MIRLEKISKAYRTTSGIHTVFKDLDLDIPTGSGVAFLGPNGVGKTTLVNIIGGAEKPDSGRVITDGRISWPIGLAGGFQPSLSARENVKFVARLYAGKQDIRKTVEFVEEFADIGEYFDMPTRTYSSGMRSRVSFGLSMAFDFDYYLIDEVTAVGDPVFRKKCNQTLENKRKSDAGFIVVSHQMDIVNKFCDCVAVLSPGSVKLYSDVKSGIKAYLGEGASNPSQAAGGQGNVKPIQELAIKPVNGEVKPLISRADRVSSCFFDNQNKKIRASFHLLALFGDREIDDFILCDSSSGVWKTLPARAVTSPVAAQLHPELVWSKQSRFVFDLDLALPASPLSAGIMARCGDEIRPLMRFQKI